MMFQAASSHSEVDDVGIPSWVKKVPLEESPEIAALTARDVTTPFFVMAHYWDYLLSQRQDLMLVSPFQDYSDRSDLVFLAMMAPVIPLTSNSVVSHYTKVRLMGQAIPKTFVPTLTALMGLKHGFAMMMFGGSIVLSDYLTMNLSRRIAEKQGHVFGTNEDVERRPIHVASGFAMTGTVLTFLDAARPISLAWNLARWAGGGFVAGYALGIIKCKGKQMMIADTSDNEVADNMRKALYSDILEKSAKERATPPFANPGVQGL